MHGSLSTRHAASATATAASGAISPLAAFALGLILFTGCGDDDKKPNDPVLDPPTITSIEPDSVSIGGAVTINGARFGDARGSSDVFFGTREALTPTWTNTRIVATVPTGAVNDSVEVVVDGMRSNALAYTVLAEPASPLIARLVPARTIVNRIITIAGTGLDPAGEDLTVTFQGPTGRIEAQVTAFNDNGIRARVPIEAVSGSVRVDIGQAASNEVQFTLAPRAVQWTADILPLVTSEYGCTGCHGGGVQQNGLRLDSALNARNSQSVHAPVIIPEDSAESILPQKISPKPPFGARMPFGCSQGECVTEAHQLLFRDWIDQGAAND